MSFELCNALAMIQRCMLVIFFDLVGKSIEVLMDRFFVYGDSFDACLENINVVLRRCIKTNLIFNWEKCHFIVKKGIVLIYKIYEKTIEVDPTKVEVISKLPLPFNVKGIRSFLGHVGLYHRFIKDFANIVKLLINLLVNDIKFNFDQDCFEAFEKLKCKLSSTLVITPPNWNFNFEIMCDVSDHIVPVVLGQRKKNKFHVIHYVSKVLNEA